MIKLLSLFSGIGAFEVALKKLGIDYELVNYCDIDKFASKSYSAIHDVSEEKNLWDITTVDTSALPNDIDLVSYGFPCQDISLAGKQKGLFNEDGSTTRSGLFFEALRIIEDTQPRIAIAENVKNLTGKKFKDQFEIVLSSLENAGYNNYWKVLNAKDFGIPQNRERVFIISIRKDVDQGDFEFPEGFPLQLRLKDMLDKEVDESYYLDKKFENISIINDYSVKLNGGVMGKRYNVCRVAYDENHIAPTVNTCQGGGTEPKVMVHNDEPSMAQCIGGVGEKKSNGGKQYYQQDRIYQGDIALAHPANIPGGRYNYVVDDNCDNMYAAAQRGRSDGQQMEISDREYANAITTVQKDSMVATKVDVVKQINEEIGVIVQEATKKGYAIAQDGDSINLARPNDKTRRGRVGKGVSQTLTTSPQMYSVICDETQDEDNRNVTFRIRKLTPKECWRLMGFDDEDFEKAAKVVSKSQLYKQAGNSICVDVLYYLIGKLRKYF